LKQAGDCPYRLAGGAGMHQEIRIGDAELRLAGGDRLDRIDARAAGSHRHAQADVGIIATLIGRVKAAGGSRVKPTKLQGNRPGRRERGFRRAVEIVDSQTQSDDRRHNTGDQKNRRTFRHGYAPIAVGSRRSAQNSSVWTTPAWQEFSNDGPPRPGAVICRAC
jgi:hypothetical protein